MLRRVTLLGVLATLICFMPGAASPLQAASTRFIRIATLVPRDSDLARSFLKLESFERAGWKLIGWSEAGQYRWFSRGPNQRPSDLQQRRPWLWPASFILKELYHVVGCNGVPLGVPEVFGALQTRMIDTVISTAAALVALQWHPTLKHVTQQTFGVLINGLVMSGSKWKQLPPDVAAMLMAESARLIAAERADVREADRRSYENLLNRGYTADKWAPNGYEEYVDVEKRVRERLVNRLYTPELPQRVMTIAKQAS